ncbi:hypothetical protein ACFVVU_34995 [Kitasatospora sp. NPDC057965]|uniref:hypothetical protein n=1 Tax=Kitasatospora sp. NPDC057965 TaxID=3346291 RepID=UPI0036DC8692
MTGTNGTPEGQPQQAQPQQPQPPYQPQYPYGQPQQQPQPPYQPQQQPPQGYQPGQPPYPYTPQQAYAPDPYAQQGHAAQPYAPGAGQAPYGGQVYGQPPYGAGPGMDDAATALLPPVPPLEDAAATTLLPPVPPLDDAPTALLPPVSAAGPMPSAPAPAQAPDSVQGPARPYTEPRHGRSHRRAEPPAPAPSPAPTQAQAPAQAYPPVQSPDHGQGLDQPTMTLKRPEPPAPVLTDPAAARAARAARAAQNAHAAPAGPAASFPGPAPSLGTPPFPPATPVAPVAQPSPVQAAAPAAPARTGSPIHDPGLQPALITAGAAALLAGGAALGQVPLALVLVLLQGLTAAGWFRLNGMWPARQGIALAALSGVVADVSVLLADADGGTAAVVGTLGGFFLLVLVLQTFRPADPKERFYALTVLGSATVVTVLCTALLLADWVPAAVGAVALATLLAAAPLPGPRWLGPLLGLAAAVGLGFAVGAPPFLGVAAGLGALIGRRVAAYDFPSRFVHMTAGVALPLAVSAPLVWIATALLG